MSLILRYALKGIRSWDVVKDGKIIANITTGDDFLLHFTPANQPLTPEEQTAVEAFISLRSGEDENEMARRLR